MADLIQGLFTGLMTELSQAVTNGYFHYQLICQLYLMINQLIISSSGFFNFLFPRHTKEQAKISRHTCICICGP